MTWSMGGHSRLNELCMEPLQESIIRSALMVSNLFTKKLINPYFIVS